VKQQKIEGKVIRNFGWWNSETFYGEMWNWENFPRVWKILGNRGKSETEEKCIIASEGMIAPWIKGYARDKTVGGRLQLLESRGCRWSSLVCSSHPQGTVTM